MGSVSSSGCGCFTGLSRGASGIGEMPPLDMTGNQIGEEDAPGRKRSRSFSGQDELELQGAKIADFDDQPDIIPLSHSSTLEGRWSLHKEKSDSYDALLKVLGVCWHPALLTRCHTPEYEIGLSQSSFTAFDMGKPMYAVIPLDGSLTGCLRPQEELITCNVWSVAGIFCAWFGEGLR
eukprot:TRINITY_DN50712_c0_g1_i1.p1 TRINITY_DN50712_c0_g1~~TRINITY_DN50712_c0_g1_i1.p1  ORF type:complete len:191 (+),score=29.44 TRINITY_DN50712_c0_g1_i1:41-574(+)